MVEGQLMYGRKCWIMNALVGFLIVLARLKPALEIELGLGAPKSLLTISVTGNESPLIQL